MPPHAIGYLCLLAGISMVAGWWIAFRNRIYLLLLGIFFLALAGSFTIGRRLQLGPVTPGLRLGWWIAVGMAAVALAGAFITAIQESRQRFREMREHYKAASEALLTITQAEIEKAQQPQQAQKTSETTPEDDREVK